jgi:hypothetical protein
MSFRSTVTLAGLVAIVLILAGRAERHSELAAQALQVDPAELELGEISLQEPITRLLTIRNQSTRDVRITDFETSCGCTSVTPHSLTLRPNESRAVRVTIDLLQIARQSPQAASWPLELTLRPTFQRGVVAGSWRFQGTLTSPLTAVPEIGNEPLVLDATEEPQKITIPVHFRRGVSLARATCSGPGSSCAWSVPRDGEGTVEIMLDPGQKSLGPFLTRCLLHLHSPAGEPLPPLPIEIRGEVRSSVVLEPSLLLLGVRTSPAIVTLRSNSGRPFEILEVGTCRGIGAELLPGDENDFVRTLQVVATEADESLTVVPLHIDVRAEGSTVRERLTLQIQRPTRLFLAAATAAPPTLDSSGDLP